MDLLKRYGPGTLLVLVALLLLYAAFGKMLTQSNAFMLVPGGDGLKNYFMAAYYVKYGDGGWIQGLTYPFGEMALFADGHFGLAHLMHWIDTHLFRVRNHTVGTINFLVITSVAWCALFVYLVLRKLRLPVWYAFMFALIIAFLSPQIQRISAHYSLGYCFLIPMIWFFILQLFDAERKWLWALISVISILFFGLLHPYYVPLLCFFILAYGFVFTLQHIKNFKANQAMVFWLMGIGLGTLLVFMAGSSMADPITDRHPNPYGMFVYMASFESIFLPSFGPVLDLWDYFTHVKTVTKEGLAYVGIVGFLMLVFTAVRLIRRMVKRQFSKAVQFTGSKHLNGMLWAGLLLALLATAVPFTYFPFLLDWLPPLRQFRSLGRFAWVFFYVFTVYGAYYFYLIYRSMSVRGNQPLALSLVLVVALFWGLEAFINVTHLSKEVWKAKQPNTVLVDSNQDYSRFLKDAGYQPEDFQAMIGLPYFNNGSEKLYIINSGQAVYESLKCVYDTNIPAASLLSPRSSLSQTYDLAQLLSSNLIEKQLLPKLDDRPFLLLKTNERLQPFEQALIDKAERIYENPYIQLFKLPVIAFQDKRKEAVNTYEARKDSLVRKDEMWVTDSVSFAYANGFEENSTDIRFTGNGAMVEEKVENMILFDEVVPSAKPLQLEVSAWIYSDDRFPSYPILHTQLLNADNGVEWHEHYNPKLYTEVYNGWAKATLLVNYTPGQRLKIFVKHENEEHEVILDNLLIRPASIDVYQENAINNQLLFNNYVIRIGE